MRYEPDKRLRTRRGDEAPVELVVCTGPADEAVTIVDRIAARRSGTPAPTAPRPSRGTSPSSTASTATARRSSPGSATRTSRTPSSVGLSLFETPEIRDLEQTLRAIADPHQDVALLRMLSAGTVAARRARDPGRCPDGPLRPAPHRRGHARRRRDRVGADDASGRDRRERRCRGRRRERRQRRRRPRSRRRSGRGRWRLPASDPRSPGRARHAARLRGGGRGGGRPFRALFDSGHTRMAGRGIRGRRVAWTGTAGGDPTPEPRRQRPPPAMRPLPASPSPR